METTFKISKEPQPELKNIVSEQDYITTTVICINSPQVSTSAVGNITSGKHLRTKVTPDLHLINSKNGGNLGLVLKR